MAQDEKRQPDIEGVDDETLQAICNSSWDEDKIPESVEIALTELQRRAIERGRY